MADYTPIKFRIEELGEDFQFATPEELRAWSQAIFQSWQWVTGVQSPLQNGLTQSLRGFVNPLEQISNEWIQHRNNESYVTGLQQRISSIISQGFVQPTVLSPKSAAAAFVNSVRSKHGDNAGAGAYAFLVKHPVATQYGFPQPGFFEGVLEAILFQRSIDWTGNAYQSVLEELKKTYAGKIAEQDARAAEIDKRNAALNEQFDSTLREKNEALTKLHEGQIGAFDSLITKHETDLKALIETYDQKLALQKPVAYWETKEKYHGQMSKRFAIAAGVVGAVLITGMVALIHWLFQDVAQGQQPKYWEIAILATAGFFSIWVMRILLKLFFSHVHLSTDAAERRTMILTYLALSREGAEVKPEDKQLILQHLFRSASDGLVKDDGTPPSLLEFFTRVK
jgi:Family of unknown function (DUF6161)